MLKNLPFYIKIPFLIGITYLFATAYSNEKGFKERLLDYIDENVLSEETKLSIDEPPDSFFAAKRYESFSYRKGDWEKYIVTPRYKAKDYEKKKFILYESDDVNIHSYGSLNFDLIYGKSIFTSDKYIQFDGDKPVSLVIEPGFRPKQELKLHIEGKVGDRMTIFIDHDDRKKDNHYYLQYKALRDNEVIREINAGEIDINFKESKYAVYDNTTAKAMGVDLTVKKNNLEFKAFGSVTRGETEVEIFRGNTSPGNIKLSEYQYLKRVYYQIEPFIRYNNLLNPPYPANYTLKPVNINPYGFELYMDDQNPYNNNNAIQLSLDGGFYTKLQSGVDYKINYTTGLITFIREVSAKSKIFAAYNLLSGNSTDPYALPPGDPNHPGGIFTEKIFVFIKYGYSIVEETGDDRNNDGKVNQDVYEVRSFYFIGDRHILTDNFSLNFFHENSVMSRSDVSSLGKYSIDYTNGIVQFRYREPFKSLLLANNTALKIYTENQSENVYECSRYRIAIDYYKESRSFQLNHVNIIPGSVRVKIDGRELPEALYTIDYTTGFLMFSNPNNPLIGPETIIEIKYEYLPFIAQSQEFVGGLRGNYKFNRNLKIGASLLYSRSSGDEKIPDVENAPTQTIFFEGDTSVHIDSSRLSKFINLFSRKKRISIPLEINGYAEYAKSYKNVNTFGKALVDNMESSEDIITISISEKDWILSSQPAGTTTRAFLNYFFYRDISNPDSLKDIFYPALKIDYSVKPGPFNVAIGHVLDNISSQASQMSLVLDFGTDRTDGVGEGDYVSIVTRRLSDDEAVDFSGVQYVEISYRYEGDSDVDLYLDIGRINEDSDSDGILDTEDMNNNGFIDSDPGSGFTEDIGYLFNETGHTATRVGSGPNLNHITRGDGVLSSEDLNGNGILDTSESVYSFQGQNITLAANNLSWKKERLYIDHSTLSNAEINLLKQIDALRLYITKANSDKGRLYIDSIKFVSSKWRDIQLDGNETSPDRLKVSMINSVDDNEYKLESFMFVVRDLYKSLYGIQKNEKILAGRETALKLEYSIPAPYNNVSTTRRFSEPIDIRNYKTLNLWMNCRNFTSGDILGFIIGSSDTDYIEYQIPMGSAYLWQEVRLRLSNSSKGWYFLHSMSGIPDLKRTTFIKIVIYSSSPPSNGTVWLNEIYLSEPEILEDSAYWHEGEIKVTKPLYKTKAGVPILSDISVKYIQKGHGKNFSTIGKKDLDIEEDYKQVFSSFKILPNWNNRFDFTREESETDSLNEEVIEKKRGGACKNSFMFVTDYVSKIDALPSFKISYKYDDYENRIDERITGLNVYRKTDNFNHSSVINLKQNIKNILWGKLSTEFLMNMFFKKDEINRKNYEQDLESQASTISLFEIEKRQMADINIKIDYTNKIFYLRPAFKLSSEEIVNLFGKTEINNTGALYFVNGDFHFPFIYNDDCKFVERNKMASISAGINNFGYVGLGYKIDAQYFENKFSDFDINETPLYGFSRSKDARSLVSTNINIPVNFSKIKIFKSKPLKFIRSFNVSYGRSLYFTESNVPYEGEYKRSFDEKYGLGKSVNKIADAGFNIFKYWPFYFFIGRGNFARGRDFIFKKSNMQLLFKNGELVTEYDNQLRLIDNFSFYWSMDFKKLTFDSNGGLNQVCERLNIYGIPGQVFTAYIDINLGFNLMKLFHFSFFRPNKKGLPYHSAFLSLGYRFDRNMVITSNIEDNSHSPNIGLIFKRNRASIGFQFGFEFKQKNNEPYISLNMFKRSYKDQKYIDNMPQYVFIKERDLGYSFSTIFETDVVWLYNLFSLFYRLVAFPIFSLEYSMEINKYSYKFTVSPEPYDLHLISGKLALDLHKNVQGGISSRFALEQFRNEYNSNISREVLSYEFALNFKLLF